MPMNLTRKILASHLAKPSDMAPGGELLLHVDQTLTHDINAVMTYLAFEAIGLERTQVETSVSYLDHNLLYLDYKTPDDHIYLQSVAKKYGVHVSRQGNGICHTVHLSRFAVPGKLLVGGDSHTPHSGALGMLAVGVGGMDIAAAMTGVPMRLTMPRVVKVNLVGRLRPGCNAKEVILEMLRRVGIKGGLGKVFEYVGPGAAAMQVSQRATIANMGAEMGATTSIFPADEQVRQFLLSQGRGQDFAELLPDPGCSYDEEMELDLDRLEPLCACPHQPDNVKALRDVEKKRVQQVFIGSCTNTSYADVAKAAVILRGRHVHEDVSCTCAISSRQIYTQLLRDGYIEPLVAAGVRMLELACGPCCAIGQSPATKGVAVRTSNRNFKGRSGNPTAEIYLVSPESAAATAVRGTFTAAEEILSPQELAALADIRDPDRMPVDDSMMIRPLPEAAARRVEVLRGPNIQPLPIPDAPPRHLRAPISLKGGDNITTDDITPASAEFSSMRSNIPLMSQYCYHRYDPGFAARAKGMGQSIIIGGENYGQGSSREHAAINPMYLGVKAVIAKSIARIHRGNLINHGIIPMAFADPADYERLSLGDTLEIDDLPEQMKSRTVAVRDTTQGLTFQAKLDLSDSELEILADGGRLRHLKAQLRAMGVL